MNDLQIDGIKTDENAAMVLLVDDQAMIGEAVRRGLAHEENIDFHFCADPHQAIAQAIRIKPTVILQDLVMPGLDGLTLVREYRNHPATQNIPIIVLSTMEDPLIKSAAFSAGANDYLVKLPDNIELVARIRYHSRSYMTLLQRDAAYRALRVRDYGRVDLRLTEAGEIYVIEVNANCYLEEKSEFAMAARAAGIEYPELLDRIVQLAVERHGVEVQKPKPKRRARSRRPAAPPLKAGTSPSARGSSPAR